MASDIPPTGAAAYAPVASPQSAVSWPAILAGAVVALATSLLLTLVAAGLGFSLSYPGLASRGSLGAFTPTLGAGAIVVQVISGALGGYIAGRLRTTWTEVHLDEAHFRDTAHGLAAWAVSTLAGLWFAAAVLGPYADQMTAGAAQAVPPGGPTVGEVERAARLAAQSSFFIAMGMLLSAFVAAVAARLGGQQHEAMHVRRLG